MRRLAMRACVAVALVGLLGAVAWADVATPRPKWTTLRMASEEVTIALGEQKVQVDAVFQMENTGPATTAVLGYPLGVLETALNDFAVTVDGQPVKSVRSQQAGAAAGPGHPGLVRGGGGGGIRPGGGPGGVANESYRFDGPYKEWKVFDVPFGANEKKTVRVTYWVAPAKVQDAAQGALLHYTYTMKTGATWKGKIDEAKIRVKLDGVAPDRLVRVGPAGCQRTDGGKALSWTMKDFKPTDNIEITFRPASAAAAAATLLR